MMKLAHDYLSTQKNEHHIILYERGNGEIGLFDLTHHSTQHSVEYSLDSFLKIKNSLTNKTVFSAHNHPSDSAEPSISDRFAYKEFNSLLRLNNIHLEEEFIVTTTEVSSFAVVDDEYPLACDVEVINKYVSDTLLLTSNKLTSSKKINVEPLILNQLLNGFEVAVTKDEIFVSSRFTFDDLLTITKRVNEVVIWGVPYYQETTIFNRIKDINNVFGSIECYSLNNDKELFPLKNKMAL